MPSMLITSVTVEMKDISGINARDFLGKIAEAVTESAKEKSPVDTGALQESIRMELSDSKSGPVAGVGSDLNYSVYQELGTRKMAAQPYLRPALEEVLANAAEFA